ncbi:MAG TPA: acyl-CoA dehydrogenase family protein [Burkholderiales bacterium]|nr:acyl-CoA dehydrogenase family protein [Burkholderiales bacterium]
MSTQFSSDQRQLQDLIRRIGRERVAPRANDIDRSAEYPQDMFELLKSLGLFSLALGRDQGGAGDMVSSCIAVEELGRVCYNTGYLLVTQWVPFHALEAGGSAAQKSQYLPGLAAGDTRSAIALTEPHSGSDLASIRTRARKVAGGYRITGQKIWCSNAPNADFILVAAKIGDESGKINLFIVPCPADGLTIGAPEDKLGARGIPSCPLFLDEVAVPDDAIIGGEGEGFKLVMEGLNRGRPIVAARAVGCAQGALDHAVQFIQNRFTRGKRVDEFQGIRWMIADMEMKIQAGRELCYKAAAMVDAGVRGPEMAKAAAVAKAFCTDMAMQVTTDAVQLFGATGISNEAPINRYMRDAKVTQIIEGTNQIQRNIIADVVLGRSHRGA